MPTTAERDAAVARAVAAWQANQPDLVTCPLGTITLRDCDRYQEERAHDDSVVVHSNNRVRFKAPRFARCRGANCPRYQFKDSDPDRDNFEKGRGKRKRGPRKPSSDPRPAGGTA